MDMSLDEYIQGLKNEKDPILNHSTIDNETKFKEGRRREEFDDIDDNDLEISIRDSPDLIECNKVGEIIEQRPSNLQVIRRDLRDKLNMLSHKWRNPQPNVETFRSAVVPPSVSLQPTAQNNNNGNGLRRKRNRNRRRYHNHNFRCNKNEQIQYPRDIRIDCPANGANGFSGGKNQKQFPMSQSYNVVSDPATSSLNDMTKTRSEFVKSLLGVNDNLQHAMMPILATKLLDFFNGGHQTVVHKPIYDMKIQKEIHEIQKKSLIYKCPGGEIISCDGKGIDNVTIQPQGCGISLNNRFA